MANYRTHAPYHMRYRPVHDVMVITHPLYATWCGIKDRCNNADNPAYGHYGGRGITICPAWDVSFEQFALDMGLRPTSAHSIDRIDNDKGYCKANCRWATRTQQMKNRRKFKTNTSGETGIVIAANGAFIARYDDNGVRHNLGRFQSLSDAIAYRQRFIETLSKNVALALKMTERRARYDSNTKVRGITVHADGFMVRKTINGVRVFIGLAGTLGDAIAMMTEFDSLPLSDALVLVAGRPRSNNKSKYRGVAKKGKGYTVKKKINGTIVYLGYRDTMTDAEALWEAN